MYNLEIEVVHNFTTQGYISHNCLDPLFDAIDLCCVGDITDGELDASQFD